MALRMKLSSDRGVCLIRLRFLAVPVMGAAIACATAFMVPAAASTAGWENAMQVPGTAALNTGQYAQTDAVSCPSAGDCIAVGSYRLPGLGPHHTLPFVADEVKGAWHKAITVPGMTADQDATAIQASCASPGNCALALTIDVDKMVFVASEVHGIWQKAVEVPGKGRRPRASRAAPPATAAPSAGTPTPRGPGGDSWSMRQGASGARPSPFPVSAGSPTAIKAQA
jgi:hypothetical protein